MTRGFLISAKTGQVVYDEPEPISAEQQRENAKQARWLEFTRHADPLFMKYERGEETKQKWLDMVEEIRQRHPYPEDEE